MQQSTISIQKHHSHSLLISSFLYNLPSTSRLSLKLHWGERASQCHRVAKRTIWFGSQEDENKIKLYLQDDSDQYQRAQNTYHSLTGPKVPISSGALLARLIASSGKKKRLNTNKKNHIASKNEWKRPSSKQLCQSQSHMGLHKPS